MAETSYTGRQTIPAVGFRPDSPENIRMLVERLQRDIKSRELSLPDPGRPSAAAGDDISLPEPAQDSRASAGPIGQDALRRAIEAKNSSDKKVSQSLQSSALRSKNDASLGASVAESYGKVAGPRSARREEARTTGINVDPAQVQADASAATDSMADEVRAPRDYKREFAVAERSASVAKELARHKSAMDAWTKEKNRLEAELGSAKEDGYADKAWEITQRLDAHQKAMPVLSEQATGGRTPQELMESVADTFARLGDEDKNVLIRHAAEATLTQRERMLPPNKVEELIAERGSALLAQLAAGEDSAFTPIYDSLDPQARLQEMKNNAQNIRSAPSVPTVDLDFDEHGGYGKGVGDDARAGNAAIPAGGMGDMPRSAKLGDAPVTKRGTKLIQNPDGSSSMRAFSPDQIGPYMHLDPYPPRITPEWTEQMKAAGAAMGLDYRRFANEGMFVAAAAKRLAEQQRLLGRVDDPSTPSDEGSPTKYETQALPTGGYRMRPTEQTTAQRDLAMLRADIKKTGEARGLPREVQGELQSILDEAEKKLAEGTLDARAMADITKRKGAVMREYYTQNAFDRGEAWKTRQQQQVFSRDLRNPDVAPGMLKDSLGVAGTDPSRQSLVYRQFGAPGEAARIDSIEAQRQIAEASAANELARIEAAGKPKQMMPSDANAAGARAALEQAFDPELGPETGFGSFLVSQRQLEGETKSPANEEDLRKRFAAMMLAKSPDVAWNTQFVQGILRKLKRRISPARVPLSAVNAALSPKEYFLSSIRESFGPQFEQKASAWWDANP